jgi:hypothetical protein
MTITRQQLNSAMAAMKKAGWEHFMTAMNDQGTGGIHFQHKQTGEFFILDSKNIDSLPINTKAA